MTTSEPPPDQSRRTGHPGHPADPGRPGRPGHSGRPPSGAGELHPGTRVEVRNRFDGSWAPGFELAEPIDDDGWHVRRLSDGSVLPRPFPQEAVRRERSRQTWWISGSS